MKKTLKGTANYLDRNKRLLVISTLLILVVFGVFIFTDRPYIIHNDQWFQYNVFYGEWIRLVKDFLRGEGLPFYSWNMFLGTDFYSSMAYYVTGDIFLPLLLLVKDVETGLFLETILCIYISALLFKKFLEMNDIKDTLTLDFISIVYAFGGWATLFFGQYMFHRFYAFLPLILIGIERYFKNKKVDLIILSSLILFLQNYYLMYPTIIFLFIYCLIKEYAVKANIKKVLIDAFKILGAMIVGFMISCVILFPAIIYTLNNPRLGAYDNGGIFWKKKIYFGFIFNLISSPFPVYTNYGNAFGSWEGWHDQWYSLFVTIVPLVHSISFVIKKESRSYLIGLLALITSLIFKPLSSILHGFSEPSLRWTFLIVVYILLLAAKGMECKDDKKIDLIIASSYFALLIVMLFWGIQNQVFVFEWHKEHILSLFVCFVLGVLIYIIYIYNRKLGIALCIMEVALVSMSMECIYSKYSYEYEETINREYVEYFSSIDEDKAYRYYYDHLQTLPTSDLNLNKSLDYGFMGTKTYSSLYETSTNKLLEELEINGHIINIDEPHVLNMLGTKYYIVSKEEELPTCYNFEYCYNLDHLMVYENLDYNGFGYCMPNIEYISELNGEFEKFDYTIFVEDDVDISEYNGLSYSKFITTEKNRNQIRGEIYLEKDNILFLPIPNNSGWNVEVNNTVIEPVNVNGGFLGIKLNEGLNVVSLEYVSPGFFTGLKIFAVGAIMGIIIMIKENYIKRREK